MVVARPSPLWTGLMAGDAPTTERQEREGGGRSRRLAWYQWAGLALWIAAMAFCVQFALASAQELEGQATILGWVLVAILLLGGLAVWGAHSHPGERNQKR